MPSVRWPIPVASIGCSVAIALTLLRYIEAHRLGQAGTYLPMVIGSLAAGVVAGVCTYFAVPESERPVLGAILVGALVTLAGAALLTATLIWGYGS